MNTQEIKYKKLASFKFKNAQFISLCYNVKIFVQNVQTLRNWHGFPFILSLLPPIRDCMTVGVNRLCQAFSDL